MKNEKKAEETAPEIKERATVWLYPSTMIKMDDALSKANCKTRSEFIEQAIRFYTGYVFGSEAAEYLPEILVAAIRGTLECSENRISRLLFKLAVEIDMMTNVLAAGMAVTTEELDELREQCVRNVKKTNGSISYKESVERIRYGG